MAEIVVFSINIAKSGMESQLEVLLSSLVAPTTQEAGMIKYELCRDKRNPRAFVFHEIWASQQALDDHLNTSHIAEYRRLAPDMLEHKSLHITERVAPVR
ncbi:putative quinol monooxygenase [Paraburkholderia sp. SIMBA_027]|uniref:putative quinol monooxygenase n=1 Tax=Paraburkholderia sp. SIMBA_027 TaxID=3085770 RepID=UPI00397AE076